jgi:cytochrome c biogenesis protein CcmG, thiol:disulfide interchange protein DsbE
VRVSLRGVLAALCLAMPIFLMVSRTSFASDGTVPFAPDFTRTDLKGEALTLRGYRGKLVLLNFWATWCGPCLTEIPQFVAWQRRYKSAGLQIVGVSMDDAAEPVKLAYEKYHINYPVVMGDAALGERFGGVLGLPLSYLIDPDGHVVGRYQGKLNMKKVKTQIRSLLRGQ